MLNLEQHLKKFRKESLPKVSVSNPILKLGTNPSYTCRHNCITLKEETIFLDDTPFWRIYFHSKFTNGIEHYPKFSQQVLDFLIKIHQEHPQLRKPTYIHSKEFEYVSSFFGTIREFHGLEHIIFNRETLVFKQSFHGGLYEPSSIQLV